MVLDDPDHAIKTIRYIAAALDSLRFAKGGFDGSHWGYCSEQLRKAIENIRLARFHVDVLNLLQLKEELELEVITQRGGE